MRLSLYIGLVAVFWALSILILQAGKKQNPFANFSSPPSAPEAQEQIKQAFLHAWTGYSKYAWGKDELCSLTKVINT